MYTITITTTDVDEYEIYFSGLCPLKVMLLYLLHLPVLHPVETHMPSGGTITSSLTEMTQPSKCRTMSYRNTRSFYTDLHH